MANVHAVAARTSTCIEEKGFPLLVGVLDTQTQIRNFFQSTMEKY
jgi:hypothetical protein